MPGELFKVRLVKEVPDEPWGFTLGQGTNQQPVKIVQITPGSLADRVGLNLDDVIIQVNNVRAGSDNLDTVQEVILKAGNQFELIFLRSVERSEDPRYDGLKDMDRSKVGFHDVQKPVLRKDWNCPWVNRDGRGLKKVLRHDQGTEPVPAPIKTSHFHFYSEPHSILAPEPTAQDLEQQLERIVQEQLAREQAAAAEEKKDREKMRMTMTPAAGGQVVEDHVPQDHGLPHQKTWPDAEAVEAPEQLDRSECVQPDQVVMTASACVGEDDEDDLNGPPELETIQGASEVQQILDESALVREIQLAIEAGMEDYQGSERYEPSADELIDVLKSLENLAATNSALYRAIVDQIKGRQSMAKRSNSNNGHQRAPQHQKA